MACAVSRETGGPSISCARIRWGWGKTGGARPREVSHTLDCAQNGLFHIFLCICVDTRNKVTFGLGGWDIKLRDILWEAP